MQLKQRQSDASPLLCMRACVVSFGARGMIYRLLAIGSCLPVSKQVQLKRMFLLCQLREDEGGQKVLDLDWIELHCYKTSGGSRGRSQGATDPPFQSIASYVALVQLLASYLSVFVAIVVWFNDCTCCFDVSTARRVFQVNLWPRLVS